MLTPDAVPSFDRPTRPIYLHFLDRELNDAVHATIDGPLIERLLKVAILATGSPLYCGISAVYEHPSVPSIAHVVEDLAATGHLDLVGHHASTDSLISSHRLLYEHDRDRYPAYFKEPSRRWKTTSLKPHSTTEELEARLLSLTDPLYSEGLYRPGREGLRVIELGLLDRRQRAITSALFRDPVGSRKDLQEEVAISISVAYTTHYLRFLGGAVLNGIAGLEDLDGLLPERSPMRDVVLLEMLCRDVGLGEILDTPWASARSFWLQMLREGRGALAAKVQAVVGLVVAHQSPEERLRLTRNAAQTAWRSVLGAPPDAPVQWHEALGRAGRLLDGALALLYPTAQAVAEYPVGPPVADLLLVTATETEVQALIHQMDAAGHGRGVVRRQGDVTFTDFGMVGSSYVCHVETQMGSLGVGGSALTVSDAIQELTPRAVLMLGICFGVDPVKVPLSSVIIGERVLEYANVRASTAPAGDLVLECRGDRVPADGPLVQLARAVTREFAGTPGLMLSGPALVDHQGFKDAIVAMPEAKGALGGEMEGEGLVAAAARRRCPWLMVKAVCDFADGLKGKDKTERQEAAAMAAARFAVRTAELF